MQITPFARHWSNDSKQEVAAITQNLCCELIVDGDATQLVEGLSVGGTVWKGTNGCASSYHCGKSIYGQGISIAHSARSHN